MAKINFPDDPELDQIFDSGIGANFRWDGRRWVREGFAKFMVDPSSSIPAGGTENQIIVKNSSTNYDTGWRNLGTPGNSTISAVRYNGNVRSSGTFYGGTTNPTSTTRINYDGILHTTDAVATSDENLKQDINTLKPEYCLEITKSLRPVEFNWKIDGRYDQGLIAQEVHQICPWMTDEEGTAVKYQKLVTYLIGAIQDLEQRIAKLEEKKDE